MSENITIETIDKPPREVEEVIQRGLHEHNLAVLGPEIIYHYHHIAIAARDSEGAIVGGIVGDMVWDFLHVDVLWVAESQRGQDIGSQLIEEAERLALERGFPRLSLETTSFQALGFYQKHGFTIAGAVPNKPKGHTWYFLEKDLVVGRAEA